MIVTRHYREGAPGAEDCPPERIDRALAEKDGLVWVDVAAPTPHELALLSAEFDVHHLALEDLIEPRQRPKLEQYGDHFLLVARDCWLEEDELIAMEVDVVFGDGWVITVRKPSHRGHAPLRLDDVALRFERQRSGEGATDEGFLIYVLLDTLVDRYFGVTDRFEDEIDRLEVSIFDEENGTSPVQLQQQIYRLRTELLGFRRSIAPLREVLASLLRHEVPFLGETSLVHLQDVYDHLLRIADLNESQRDLLAAALEARLALEGYRMNRVMKRMTSWGAILLGATLVAGIYGMNFTSMPELDWAFGYPLALGMMAVLTGGLYWWFKRHDWL